MVFDTHGITSLRPDQQDTFYIKRLVGLGGETLSLKQDYEVENVPLAGTQPVGHLVVDGRPLSASTPHLRICTRFPDASRAKRCWNINPITITDTRMLQSAGSGRKCSGGDQPFFCHGRQYLQQLRLALLGRFFQRPRHREILLCLLAHHPTVRMGKPIRAPAK